MPIELVEHCKRLVNNLAYWLLKREPMDGDGDCLFSSITFGLLQLARNANAHALDILQPFTDSPDISIDHIVPNLCHA